MVVADKLIWLLLLVSSAVVLADLLEGLAAGVKPEDAVLHEGRTVILR